MSFWHFRATTYQAQHPLELPVASSVKFPLRPARPRTRSCPSFDDSTSIDDILAHSNHSLGMAPNVAESQHAQISDTILSSRPRAKIANVIGCREHSVFAIQTLVILALPKPRRMASDFLQLDLSNGVLPTALKMTQ